MGRMKYRLQNTWAGSELPENIEIGRSVYIESAFGFQTFFSERDPGLVMEEGSGIYGAALWYVGPKGRVRVGAYACLNGASIECHEDIRIGSHCLLSWGCVVTDLATPRPEDLPIRRNLMVDASLDPRRCLPVLAEVRPVVVEDNAWIGFSAVIGAGVRIGRGSVVSARTVVTADVAPYTVVAGNPARVIARLDADDTPEARAEIFRGFGLAMPPQTGC
jgi:acetyltransferase-like isoleucine patch superfamily enzyme